MVWTWSWAYLTAPMSLRSSSGTVPATRISYIDSAMETLSFTTREGSWSPRGDLCLLLGELLLGEDSLRLQLTERLELLQHLARGGRCWRCRLRLLAARLLVGPIAGGTGLGVTVGELRGLAALHAAAP